MQRASSYISCKRRQPGIFSFEVSNVIEFSVYKFRQSNQKQHSLAFTVMGVVKRLALQLLEPLRAAQRGGNCVVDAWILLIPRDGVFTVHSG